jgi:hypothetical protein
MTFDVHFMVLLLFVQFFLVEFLQYDPFERFYVDGLKNFSVGACIG